MESGESFETKFENKKEKSYHSSFAMLRVFCAPIILRVRGQEMREGTYKYMYGGAPISGEWLSSWSVYGLVAWQAGKRGLLRKIGWGCAAHFLKLLTYS